MLKNWVGLILTFENSEFISRTPNLKAKLQGVMKKLKSRRFLKCVICYKLITDGLSKSSLITEEGDVQVYDIKPGIVACLDELNDLESDYELQMSTIKDYLEAYTLKFLEESEELAYGDPNDGDQLVKVTMNTSSTGRQEGFLLPNADLITGLKVCIKDGSDRMQDEMFESMSWLDSA